MHRDEEADVRAAREQIAAAVEIDQTILVRVDEHGNRAQFHDGQSGGEGGEGSGQDALARSAAEGFERDFDGVETAADGGHVRDSPKPG